MVVGQKYWAPENFHGVLRVYSEIFSILSLNVQHFEFERGVPLNHS